MMTPHSHHIPAVGQLPAGRANLITDVPGVTVGHCTLAQDTVQTGVTVVYPHTGNLFCDKVPAAATVINGFGKSVGLVQVSELGVLETPIALTNTFSVSAVAGAQIRQAIKQNNEIGRQWSTVNSLVFECNDGFLNDIQAMAVTEAHYLDACKNASTDFAQGAVGAGRGMSCFELKGGIGSASRIAMLNDGRKYHVGALVLSNFGRLPHLILAGHLVGNKLNQRLTQQQSEEKGSIIILLATDAPLDSRQLRRLSARSAAGLARTGSFYGNGSGDIALAFSTAYTLPHQAERAMPALTFVHDSYCDPLFQAAVESVEQAIIHSLFFAETVTGRDGHTRQALTDLAPDINRLLA